MRRQDDLYLDISTRYTRDATQTTREQQLAAFRIRGWFAPRRRLSRDTSIPSSLGSPTTLLLEPPTLRTLLSTCSRAARKTVPPPKQVDFPPSRAFQSVFCRLEVCVVIRFRLLSVYLSFESMENEKKSREERIKSRPATNLYLYDAPLSYHFFVLSRPQPCRTLFSRVPNRFALAPLRYCTARGGRLDFLSLSSSLSLSFSPLSLTPGACMKYLHVNVGHVSNHTNNVSRTTSTGTRECRGP